MIKQKVKCTKSNSTNTEMLNATGALTVNLENNYVAFWSDSDVNNCSYIFTNVKNVKVENNTISVITKEGTLIFQDYTN